MKRSVEHQLAGNLDANGRGAVAIHRDLSGWVISDGRESFCYYRTKLDAETVIKTARQIARDYAKANTK